VKQALCRYCVGDADGAGNGTMAVHGSARCTLYAVGATLVASGPLAPARSSN
jgi:hypothetical protein